MMAPIWWRFCVIEAVRDKTGKVVVEKVGLNVFSFAEYHFANEEQALRLSSKPLHPKELRRVVKRVPGSLVVHNS